MVGSPANRGGVYRGMELSYRVETLPGKSKHQNNSRQTAFRAQLLSLERTGPPTNIGATPEILVGFDPVSPTAPSSQSLPGSSRVPGAPTLFDARV